MLRMNTRNPRTAADNGRTRMIYLGRELRIGWSHCPDCGGVETLAIDTVTTDAWGFLQVRSSYTEDTSHGHTHRTGDLDTGDVVSHLLGAERHTSNYRCDC